VLPSIPKGIHLSPAGLRLCVKRLFPKAKNSKKEYPHLLKKIGFFVGAGYFLNFFYSYPAWLRNSIPTGEKIKLNMLPKIYTFKNFVGKAYWGFVKIFKKI
jgi:hypothetical protein